MYRYTLLVFIALLAACLHDKNQDMAPVEDPIVENPPTYLALALGEPTVGERFGPTENITLVGSLPLLASTVEGIRLTAPAGRDLAISVDVSDKTLVIDPVLPLEPGWLYRLEVAGLKGTRGEAMVEPFTANIKVSKTFVERDETFSELLPSLEVTEFNETGTPAKLVRYSDPGIDMAWDTGDESIADYTMYEYPQAGRRIAKRYDDPGYDGLWFDSNDHLAYVTHDGTRADGQIWYSAGVNKPGPDGDWQTRDDVVAWGHAYDYAEDGRQTGLSYLRTGLGDDALPATADDVMYNYTEHRYVDNNLVAYIQYDGAGIDGDWRSTDDNDMSSYFMLMVDKYEAPVWIDFTSPGDDGDWMTEDDAAATNYYLKDSAEGAWQYNEQWETSDGIIMNENDRLLDFSFSLHGAYGQILAAGYVYWAGDDGKRFTDDDELMEFFTNEYDDELRKLAMNAFFSLGSDHVPLTGDEERAYLARYGYDELGNVTFIEYIHEPGDDGGWSTPDDPVTQRVTYRSYHGE